MLKGRRVGTLTAGIILVVFGAMFLLRLTMDNINISLIVSFWPIILVLLGIEIIVAYIINKEEKMKYDFSAIMLVIILVFFAMGMGIAEFAITHWSQFKGII
ncbi:MULTISPECIES: LiaI-LiaF-like domain-containing protein [unclassified Clostridium]|uniref:LiaI-LiaF-like domain-containing protein n=1 Tax=unclassified Clostridium TaxID=2614128 RepID=UPI003F8EFB93